MRPTPVLALCLVAALLAAPATTLTRALFLCHMTGRLAPACCCAKAAAKQRAELTGQSARGKGCCELVERAIHVSSASAPDAPQSVAPAALVASIGLSELFAAPSSWRQIDRERARGPPSLGPPLYIKHQRFLS